MYKLLISVLLLVSLSGCIVKSPISGLQYDIKPTCGLAVTQVEGGHGED